MYTLARMFRVSSGRQVGLGIFIVSGEINTSIFIPARATPRVFAERIYFGIRAAAPGIENRRRRERNGETESDRRHICSAIYHGLLFPIVGEVGVLLTHEEGQGESLKPCPIEFA